MRKQQQSKPTIAHDDATLHMFAGNLVLNTLQQALVITCLEDEVTPGGSRAVGAGGPTGLWAAPHGG